MIPAGIGQVEAWADRTVCLVPPAGCRPDLMVLDWRDTGLFAIFLRTPDGIRRLSAPVRDGVALLRLIGPPAGHA